MNNIQQQTLFTILRYQILIVQTAGSFGQKIMTTNISSNQLVQHGQLLDGLGVTQ